MDLSPSFHTKPEKQQMHVRGVVIEHGKARVTSLFPTFPEHRFLFENEMTWARASLSRRVQHIPK